MTCLFTRWTLLFAFLMPCGSLFAQSTQTPDTELSAIEASIDFTERRRRYEQDIAELESEFGALDSRLLEPLQQLTEVLRQQGDGAAVERLLARTQMLLRVEKGLTNQEQIPIIVEQMRADFSRGSWDAVTAHLESIYYLRSQDPEVAPEVLLTSLNDVRAWHLLAMYLDAPEERIRHIVESRRVQEILWQIAGELFPQDSPRLIPWLYSIAAESYRTTDYLEATGFLSPGASNHLGRQGTLSLIDDIKDIADANQNLETRAMAMVYFGDFQLLRREEFGSSIGGRVQITRRGPADQSYRQAMDLFREAGIEQARIDEFFSLPQPIPVTRFYGTLDEALAQRELAGPPPDLPDVINPAEVGEYHLGDFFAWTSNLPKAEISVAPELIDAIRTEQHTALLRFTVDSIGRPKSLRIIYSDPDENLVQSAARTAIEVTHFRPAFRNGRWRRIQDVTMRVVLPPELAD